MALMSSWMQLLSAALHGTGGSPEGVLIQANGRIVAEAARAQRATWLAGLKTWVWLHGAA